MKKVIKYIFKVIVSGIVSISILSGICFFYYNVPMHLTNNDGYTDYLWEENKLTIRATEGFAYSKTNNEGTNNLQDYNGQQIDILLMGSSQIEAFNVTPEKSITAQLNSMFDGKYYSYNIGISDHNFYTCSQNVQSALKKYKPQKYVILEVSDLFLTNDNINKVLSGTYPERTSESNKYVIILGEVPLLRRYYNQVDNVLRKNNKRNSSDDEIMSSENISNNLNSLLSTLNMQVKESGAELILLNHISPVNITPDYEEQRALWENICKENGITFLDVTPDFSSSLNNGVYVYGFQNTLPEKGHLNKNGHKIIANVIYDYICKGE